ncbi:unnamed protein product [Mytilus edulis]|uniref:Uncharacterized protein n=1 Tax=Mytilus edulis TaxID=6550 RepID=A0A8S3T6M1_MYTED|nr:unnamed protein product [Mytilus edulis]
MNSQRLSFEVEITEEISDQLDAVAVGFCHSELPQKIGIGVKDEDPPTHFEVSGGCVMFSSGGNVFAESMVPKNLKDKEKYKRRQDTSVHHDNEQNMYFIITDTSVHHDKDLNIHFIITDTSVHHDNEQSKKTKKTKVNTEVGKKKKKIPCRDFRDYEFIAVQVGKTAGNLQLIEEQLNGEMFHSTSETINESIEYYEK